MNEKKINLPCPVCGSLNITPVYPDTIGDQYPVFGYDFSIQHTLNYQLVRCNICSHHFSSPRHQDIYKQYQDVVDNAYLANKEMYLSTYKKNIKKIHKIKPGGNMLDVGCSAGYFLEVASSHYHVDGLELSSWAIEIAKKSGFKIYSCTLDDFRPEKLYDIITLWGVMEHFEHPAEEVRKLYELLNNEGIICFWTGNINSVTSRVLGRKWWYHQGQHIQMYSKKSIIKLLEDNGFEKVSIGTYTYVMTMSSISKSLARYPFIYKITKRILTSRLLSEKKINIKLPGEMLGIFRKKLNTNGK